ncbi:putative thiamin pyrophosphokinase [Cyclospora cayetanensis]|uniref:Thiamin pyrophosphokinase n=1 Tax=Cyclospora cayetanensis TaxID=88456 RepID=A0A1D3DB28_9EIME|nr:putative thiamin pyrophosphokinase [Cyclospora cayetanensis]
MQSLPPFAMEGYLRAVPLLCCRKLRVDKQSMCSQYAFCSRFTGKTAPSRELVVKAASSAPLKPAGDKNNYSTHVSSNKSRNPSLIHDLRGLEHLFKPSSTDQRSTSALPGEEPSSCVSSTAATASPADFKDKGRIILLVLNRPLPAYFDRMLESASLVIAADGAANHLLHVYRAAEHKPQQPLTCRQGSERLSNSRCQKAEKQPPVRSGDSAGGPARDAGGNPPILPTCICGDIDSLGRQALSFFSARGVPVVRLEDQDKPDLEKAFAFACEKHNFRPQDTVIIVGAIGGRFDHSIASISFLHKIHKASSAATRAPPKVLLLGGYNACILLEAGEHEILLPDGVFTEACGLLPLGRRGFGAAIETMALLESLSANVYC